MSNSRRNPFNRQYTAERLRPVPDYLVDAPQGLRIRELPTPAQPELPGRAKQGMGPIAALREFFKENGRKPDFRGIQQLIWFQKAREHGIVFEKKDFAAAWRDAVQSGYVVKLKGSPKRPMQSKRARKG